VRQGAGEGGPGRVAQRLVPGGHGADRDGHGRIGDVAVEPRRHVQLDQIAGEEAPRAGHAVHHFVVDADAAETGEVVDRLRRGFGALPAQEGGADVVERRGRHPRRDGSGHGPQGFADEAPDRGHAVALGVVADGHPKASSRK
jgi:hypothetical protein